MRFFIVTLATLLSTTTFSFAGILSCKAPMQSFKLISGNNSVILELNDNANNNPNKVILRDRITTIRQDGHQTIFSYNPWNIEIKIDDLDRSMDIYSGTIDFHPAKAHNPRTNINCVKI